MVRRRDRPHAPGRDLFRERQGTRRHPALRHVRLRAGLSRCERPGPPLGTLRLRGPRRRRRAMAELPPRPPEHGPQPDPSRLLRRRTLVLPDRQGDLQHPGMGHRHRVSGVDERPSRTGLRSLTLLFIDLMESLPHSLSCFTIIIVG